MSKKHYIAIAAAFNMSRPVNSGDAAATFQHDTWCTCVDNVATALARDNGAFNRSRFLVACGAED